MKTSRLRWLKAALAIGLLSLAAFLLYRTLSSYSMEQIARSVTGISSLRLGLAVACAAASYLCLTGFDWLAVRYAGKPLPYRSTALASFCALSLGHNIGFAALSSGTIRYRFYSQWGLTVEDIAKVILFCGMTVGLGLMVMGGLALLLRPVVAEEMTGLSEPTILVLGGSCLALVLVYLVLSATVRGTLRFRRWSMRMPPLRLALGQVIVGPVNFAFVAACLHQGIAAVAEIPYIATAAAFVIANVSALVSHVPGGLGVIEGVVLFLLPHAEVIGALVVFRVVYFLIPLAIGGATFAILEGWRGSRKLARRQ